MHDAQRAALLAQAAEHRAEQMAIFVRQRMTGLLPTAVYLVAEEYAQAAAQYQMAAHLAPSTYDSRPLIDGRARCASISAAWRDALLAHVNGAPLIAPRL
jgi:hypothetical protein